MSIREKRLKKLKTDLSIIFAAHIVVAIMAWPIYLLESQYPGATILSVGDALWFLFVTLSTIGYGDLLVQDDSSKWLVLFAFIITRGFFLLAIFSTTRAMFSKNSDELNMDERLTVMENDLRLINGSLYNIDKSIRHSDKKERQNLQSDKTFNATTEESLIDLVDNPHMKRSHIHCHFPMSDLYKTDVELWLTIKLKATQHLIHSISFSDGQCINLLRKKIRKNRHKKP